MTHRSNDDIAKMERRFLGEQIAIASSTFPGAAMDDANAWRRHRLELDKVPRRKHLAQSARYLWRALKGSW